MLRERLNGILLTEREAELKTKKKNLSGHGKFSLSPKAAAPPPPLILYSTFI